MRTLQHMKRVLRRALIIACFFAAAAGALTEDRVGLIQPDYDKWQRVKKGMTEDEVTQLLGQPEGGGMKIKDHPELAEGGTTARQYWPLHQIEGIPWWDSFLGLDVQW